MIRAALVLAVAICCALLPAVPASADGGPRRATLRAGGAVPPPGSPVANYYDCRPNGCFLRQSYYDTPDYMRPSVFLGREPYRQGDWFTFRYGQRPWW
ncbi:MAG: hypothetical protein IT537_09355 [Hyphomicrobiales bacterium]|nr:hypothetical protein [Hyphomicrobiales bacterium]